MKRNISDIKKFRKDVNRPLILDGAVGSLLQQSGINDPDLWTSKANLTHPEKIFNVHKLYCDAGADIITTNTFRTNPVSFNSSGLNVNYKDFVFNSVRLAYKAAEGKRIYIAASNAPAEDCYAKSREISFGLLEKNHKEHISYLWESGFTDFILNETFSHLDEIKIVCRHCSENNIPFVISLFSIDGKTILSGENLDEVISIVSDYNPLAVSFNCIFPEIYKIISLSLNPGISSGFYLNCGSGEFEDSEINCGISPLKYLNEIKPYIKGNLLFLGSCCGSTPEHTKIMRQYFDK